MGRIESVLVVDDDRWLLASFERSLMKQERSVCKATSARDAKELTGQRRFDLAIVDLTLDDGWGYDVVTDLRARGVAHTIAMLTGWEAVATRDAARLAGADFVFFKPFPPANLVEVIEDEVAPDDRDLDDDLTCTSVLREHVARVVIAARGDLETAARLLRITSRSLRERQVRWIEAAPRAARRSLTSLRFTRSRWGS